MRPLIVPPDAPIKSDRAGREKKRKMKKRKKQKKVMVRYEAETQLGRWEENWQRGRAGKWRRISAQRALNIPPDEIMERRRFHRGHIIAVGHDGAQTYIIRCLHLHERGNRPAAAPSHHEQLTENMTDFFIIIFIFCPRQTSTCRKAFAILFLKDVSPMSFARGLHCELYSSCTGSTHKAPNRPI